MAIDVDGVVQGRTGSTELHRRSSQAAKSIGRCPAGLCNLISRFPRGRMHLQASCAVSIDPSREVAMAPPATALCQLPARPWGDRADRTALCRSVRSGEALGSPPATALCQCHGPPGWGWLACSTALCQSCRLEGPGVRGVGDRAVSVLPSNCEVVSCRPDCAVSVLPALLHCTLEQPGPRWLFSRRWRGGAGMGPRRCRDPGR